MNSILTLERAKKLTVGTTLYHITAKNADKTPARFKLIGRPKVWKTRPEKVELSLRRGLYQFFRVSEDELYQFYLENSDE